MDREHLVDDEDLTLGYTYLRALAEAPNRWIDSGSGPGWTPRDVDAVRPEHVAARTLPDPDVEQ